MPIISAEIMKTIDAKNNTRKTKAEGARRTEAIVKG